MHADAPIALLLHMHQPDYRDPKTGEPTMPWVRLHASRGYTDVPAWIAASGAQVTVNLVPSLIDQWEHYAAGGSDLHLRLATRPADTLAPPEIEWMVQNFFHGHPSIFKWFPPYAALQARAAAPLSVADVRDLQVWSNLAWFGATALREHPALLDLRKKGRGFSEAEKAYVLGVQRQLIEGLVTRYRALPEVSCTPYFHPILPLLINTAHAQRCMPGVPDPGFRAPEDAALQLRLGRARVEAWTGRPVVGLWPSEGSVSPEAITLAAEAGFRWFATDQGVLERSERTPLDRHGGDHHGAWEVGPLRGLFRDHDLSDRVGFLYASWDGPAAAADVLARVKRPTLIALDGENPWESYRDAGAGFMETLLQSPRLLTCGALAARTPVGKVHRIHTGSWINADFHIWIGHSEDRTAWALVADARRAWEQAGRPEAARKHLLAAEGSDWFWWYGEDFSTPFAHAFDSLFRAHVRAVWEALAQPVPAALHQPIKKPAVDGSRRPKAELESPAMDWFFWARAGQVDLRAGAMAPVPGGPQLLLYGWHQERLLLRVLPAAPTWWVEVDGQTVPLHDGLADLGVRAAALVALCGPDQRLPVEGGVQIVMAEPNASAAVSSLLRFS